jgi:excisionase family DNA binding protein
MTVTASRTLTPVARSERGELRAVLADATEQSVVTIQVGGHEHQLDGTASAAVLDLLARLAAGDSVMLSSIEQLVTTSQAARMLGVSRTYVCRLMDDGKLPFEYRGTHRRVRVSDLLGYLREQEHTRREALERIQEISRAAGAYDDDF